MRIYPAPHYTMGGLWVDYNLMTSLPGLFAIGEANFSDHGANRLGASSLMQCLADGYFIIPVTIADYISRHPRGEVGTDHPAFSDAEQAIRERTGRLLSIRGSRSAESFHRELGKLMTDHCGISRSEAGLQEALKTIPDIREAFWKDLAVNGSGAELNQGLEHAGRVADFLEFAELMCLDALTREESCGCHFRQEHQTEDGEALRNDEEFAHVAIWEYTGEGRLPVLHKEPLHFEALPLARRDYKS
jgi:succinate dehydrogenase / fumarate reductase flavoprotein subunit